MTERDLTEAWMMPDPEKLADLLISQGWVAISKDKPAYPQFVAALGTNMYDPQCGAVCIGIAEGHQLVPTEPPFPQQFLVVGVRHVNGVDQDVYLTYTSEGGGWYQWSTSGTAEDNGRRFDTESGAQSAALSCPGPWYSEPAKESIKAVAVENVKAKAYREWLAASA